MKFLAGIIGILGLGQVFVAFSSWWDFTRYTISAECVVVQGKPFT